MRTTESVLAAAAERRRAPRAARLVLVGLRAARTAGWRRTRRCGRSRSTGSSKRRAERVARRLAGAARDRAGGAALLHGLRPAPAPGHGLRPLRERRRSRAAPMPLLGDGSQVRDFTYVGDAAEATALARSSAAGTGPCTTWPAAAPATLAHAFELLGEQLGRAPALERRPADGRDPRSTGADLDARPPRARLGAAHARSATASRSRRRTQRRGASERPQRCARLASAAAHGRAGADVELPRLARVGIEVERPAQRPERLPRPVERDSWSRVSRSQVLGIAGEAEHRLLEGALAPRPRGRPPTRTSARAKQRRGGERVGVGGVVGLAPAPPRSAPRPRARAARSTARSEASGCQIAQATSTRPASPPAAAAVRPRPARPASRRRRGAGRRARERARGPPRSRRPRAPSRRGRARTRSSRWPTGARTRSP